MGHMYYDVVMQGDSQANLSSSTLCPTSLFPNQAAPP